MNTEVMAKRVQELMNGGEDLATAMETALKEFTPKKSTRTVIADRVTWISSIERIEDLRKAIKIAFAKKSKAKGKPETEAKYQKEIDAGNSRLNDLIADVNSAEFPYIRAAELGEGPSGILQRYLGSLEQGLEDRIKELTGSLTNKERKDKVNEMSLAIPTRVVDDLLNYDCIELLQSRLEKGDQRVRSLVKRINFLDSLDSHVPTEITEVTPIMETLEEPVIEEPVIEEPVVEEPVIEEPVVEEPVAETTKKGKKKK